MIENYVRKVIPFFLMKRSSYFFVYFKKIKRESVLEGA